MTRNRVRTLCVATIAALSLVPTLVSSLVAPANEGAHGLTTGFGRGRLDVSGIVSEGSGGSLDLPSEPMTLTVRLSGDGAIRLFGNGFDQTIAGAATPTSVRVGLVEGGRVSIESSSRIRLHEIVLERASLPWGQVVALVALGVLAVLLGSRGVKQAFLATILLLAAFGTITHGTLSAVFAWIGLARLAPTILVGLLLTPLIFAVKEARVPTPRHLSPLALIAFASSLALICLQLALFDQPLPMGDPAAYLEMGERFARAMERLGSPFGLGPLLSEVQPYLALPATGLLYGFLNLLGGALHLKLIYAVQGFFMAGAVAALVSICEAEIGPRAGRIALALSLLHPSFLILPGIVQPEPFILAAWTLSALFALRSLRSGGDWRGFLGVGLLLGAGLSLHPQGLSFLLLAMVLCALPWVSRLATRPTLVLATLAGVFSVLLPVAAAENFSKPLAHILDKQFGFFAYTSPHPLGFWLYLDSDGWQGPLRIEDTTYQKELLALKGEGAVSSTFADVGAFISRHPKKALQTLLTNLHRLWHQPDNPFAVPFLLPYEAQIPLHRSLIVLFVISLPAMLGGRLAILALPFVMLSMTYPAYHIFNKYATPALPFTIIGAALVIDRVLEDRARTRGLVVGLTIAGLGAVMPAVWFTSLGVSGHLFLGGVRGLMWFGLLLALGKSIQIWAVDLRSKVLASLVGVTVLLLSSVAAARTDTTRGAWSVSLDRPFEVSCRLPSLGSEKTADRALDPAWLLIDVEARDAMPPGIEVNGHPLDAATPTMPNYGLATVRGHRDPVRFRQMWRAPVSEQLLSAGELRIRLTGGSGTRIFGDIRDGGGGPRLSPGNWPHLSVYRLMHEGQYRLPVTEAPPQACVSSARSGRPGVALVRIPNGDETRLALKLPRPVTWIF